MLKNYEEKQVEVREKIKTLLEGLISANKLVLKSLDTCDKSKIDEAKKHVSNMSKKTSDVDNEIIATLALHQPEAKDLRELVSFLKITNEILRASFNTRSFINGFKEVCEDIDIKIVKEYAIPMQKATVKALDGAYEMLCIDCTDESRDTYNKVLINENKTDDMYDLIEKDLLKEGKKGGEFKKIHEMLGALRKSEKIADRALGIASLLLYAKVGGELHQL